MTTDPDQSRRLSPEDAFTVLGEETRFQILQILGDADEPLTFSELFARVEYDDSSNFGYHLEKLVGHFVRKTDGGYELRQAGDRVVEAVLSGVVTDDPVIERTEIDGTCAVCDSPLELRYRTERAELYCPDCGGVRDETSATAAWATAADGDIVGYLDLPPAGVEDRTPTEAFSAAEVWTMAETQALARGVCPRCSARVESTVHVCDAHDASDGHCPQCGQQFSVAVRVACTNCTLDQNSVFTKRLLAAPDVMAFLAERGIDPLSPEGVHLSAVDETVRSTEPFDATFTFTVDSEALTVTVDETLSVVDASRHDASEA